MFTLYVVVYVLGVYRVHDLSNYRNLIIFHSILIYSHYPMTSHSDQQDEHQHIFVQYQTPLLSRVRSRSPTQHFSVNYLRQLCGVCYGYSGYKHQGKVTGVTARGKVKRSE